MNNELRKQFPAHAGLNADWSVRAWRIGTDDGGELWLLEDEQADDGTFEIVSRDWNEADDCWQCELLVKGVSVADAAARLGVK